MSTVLVAIDTSTRWAGVAALVEGHAPLERVWRSERNHGTELMPALVEVLARAGASAADITHVAVALGPGAFSALRVGISTAAGLALAKDLPAVGVSTFDLEAGPYLDHAGPESPVFALIPSSRSELAWAGYAGRGEPSHSGLATPAAFAAGAIPGALFCGEGAQEMAGLVDPSRILSGAPPTRSPLALARIAQQMFESGAGVAGAVLRPMYGRQPSITMLKGFDDPAQV